MDNTEKDILYTNNKYVKKNSLKVSEDFKRKIFVKKILKVVLSIATVILISLLSIWLILGPIRYENKVFIPDRQNMYNIGDTIYFDTTQNQIELINRFSYILGIDSADKAVIKVLPFGQAAKYYSEENRDFFDSMGNLVSNKYVIEYENGKIAIIDKQDILGKLKSALGGA